MDNKFRAWDSRNNEMVFSDETPCFYINTQGVLFMYGIPKKEGGGYHKSYDVDSFTGLTDKNGVDIYFDDMVIIYGHGCLHIEELGDLVILVDAAAENDIGEIIGNIHQSPELLEQ